MTLRAGIFAFLPNWSVLFTLFGLVVLHNHCREERTPRIHPFFRGPHSQKEKDQRERTDLRACGLKHKAFLNLLPDPECKSGPYKVALRAWGEHRVGRAPWTFASRPTLKASLGFAILVFSF